MTNSIALGLAIFLLVVGGIDYMLYGTEHFVFLGKKFMDLLEWVAFWR